MCLLEAIEDGSSTHHERARPIVDRSTIYRDSSLSKVISPENGPGTDVVWGRKRARGVITSSMAKGTLFHNPRFVAPGFLVALGALPTGQLLGLTRDAVVLFDVESGREIARERLVADGAPPFYRGRLAVQTSGPHAIVYSDVDGDPFFLVDVDLDKTALAVRKVSLFARNNDDSSSYDDAAVAFTPSRIVFAKKERVRLLDPQSGELLGDELPTGLADANGDKRVIVGKRGGVIVWRDDARVICRTFDEKSGAYSDIELTDLGGTVAGDPALADDDSVVVVPVSTESYRLELAIFDPKSGKEITSAKDKTRPSQRRSRSDISVEISPRHDTILLSIDKTLQSWSIAKAELRWAVPNLGPLMGTVLLGTGSSGRLAAARGDRVIFVDLATGKRVGDHEGPAQPIKAVVRDRHGHVVAQDNHRAYVLENGKVKSEVEVWSIHEDGGDAYLYTFDGLLMRLEQDGALSPIAEVIVDGEHRGHATTIDLKDEWLAYPDPNGRARAQLAHVRDLRNKHKLRVQKLGEEDVKPPHEVMFAGDDALAVLHVTYDEANDYKMSQSIALWSRKTPTKVLWQKPVDAPNVSGIVAVNEHLIVLRKSGQDFVVFSTMTGDVITELKLETTGEGVPAAAVAGENAILISNRGDVHRVNAKSRSVEKIATVDAGATALHIELSGKTIVAFGCHEIQEVDLGLPVMNATPKREARPRLLHRHHHEADIVAFGLSPDGSLLATGSWVGDDYERGGTLQIWDARTGRVLNVLDPIDGGVGWPDYRSSIQWSPSAKRTIALAFNTNGVGVFDAFGEAPIPRMSAYTTDGWSRPPGYTWSKKGDRIAISSWSERSYIPSCIVEVGDRDYDDNTARWFARVDPSAKRATPSDDAPSEEDERPFRDAARELHFDADGTTLFAHNGGHGQAWAVDLATGALTYLIKTGDTLFAWSRCDRYLASANSESCTVTFYDARSGEVLTTVAAAHAKGEDDDDDEEMGCRTLSWSAKGARLFVIATDRVLLFEGTKPIASHEVELEVDTDFDAWPAAWSPDGARIAWVRSDEDGESKRVEVHAVGADGLTHLTSVDVSDKVQGLLWNAPDMIACMGKSIFEGVQIETGATGTRATKVFSRDLSIPTELLPDTPSPLVADDEDLGAELSSNPAFPLLAPGGEPMWGLAFETGQIVCPAELRDQLTDALSPFDPKDVQLFEDLASALPHLPLSDEAKKKLAPALASEGEPPADLLPLESEATSAADLEPLTDLLWESVKSLSAGWHSHTSEALHEAAVIHARRGEAALAAKHARHVPQEHDRVMALADVAAWLGRRKDDSVAITTARELLGEASSIFDNMEMQDWFQPFVEADLAAAYAALGETKKSEDLFASAYRRTENAESESNIFQNCTHLAAAYLRANDVARARKAMDLGPWSAGYLHMFLPKYITHAAEIGFVDHAIDVANKCREEMDDIDSQNLQAITSAMLRADRHADLFAWLRETSEKSDSISTSSYEEQAVNDLLAKGRTAEATAHLSSGPDAHDPLVLARKMKILARYAPESVPDLLERALATLPQHQSSAGLEEMVSDLTETLTTISQGKSTAALEKDLDDEQIFRLQCGRARGGDTASVQRALEYARSRSGAKEKMESLAELAAALGSDAIFDEARTFGKELRGGDRRFALSSLMSAELRAGCMQSAYKTWRAQTKANREYEVSNLVDALAGSRQTPAVLHVLRQLGRRDDMNGLPQQILRALRQASGMSTAVV